MSWQLDRKFKGEGLNPCSCGGWSQRYDHLYAVVMLDSLNPCSCGGWSQRAMKRGVEKTKEGS